VSGHTASLQDSCVSPALVATVSDQVQAAARRRETPEVRTVDHYSTGQTAPSAKN